MSKLPLIGRITFALPFLIFGLFHLVNIQGMAPIISFMPAPAFWIVFSGLALMAAAVSIMTKKFAVYALFGLALELLLFNILLHIPGMLMEPAEIYKHALSSRGITGEAAPGIQAFFGAQLKQQQLIVTFMNFMLIGACLYMAGVFRKEESAN